MEEKQGTQGTGTSNGNGIFHIKEKIYEMILYGNPALKDFPKTERYVLAGKIRESMYTALEMAVRLEKKYHKKTTLQDLDIEIDVLRNLLSPKCINGNRGSSLQGRKMVSGTGKTDKGH